MSQEKQALFTDRNNWGGLVTAALTFGGDLAHAVGFVDFCCHDKRSFDVTSSGDFRLIMELIRQAHASWQAGEMTQTMFKQVQTTEG